MAAQVLPLKGYRLVGLLEPMEPRELFDLFASRRQAFGVRLLPAGTAALRELVAALRRNESLAMVTDRDISGRGPELSFFGARTTFPDGAAALSLRTGAPVLPAVATRLPDGRFRARIEPPVESEHTGDTRADTLRLTAAIARRLEYHIANYPEQWTVFQRRWPGSPQSGA